MSFFIPGTHPKLTKAELEALDPEASFSVVSEGVFVGELQKPVGTILNRSAGVIKAGELFSAVETYEKETVAALLGATIEREEEKLNIGISVYDAGGEAFRHIYSDQSRLGLTLKSLLKDTGRSVRFVTSKDPTLSSVVVQKNHLLDRGAEFVLIVTPEKILIGQTNFVQDFEAWGRRDYGRPARDAKSGMLPPKLARLMVNLSGIDPQGARLWDPFCGSGTVLMEAALLGYQDITGSDISERAITDTERNLRWLEHHEKTTSTFTTLVHDATEPLPKELGSFDAIVAEGYLGPSRQRNRETEKHRHKDTETQKHLTQQLEELYKETIPQVLKRLKPDGTAVIAVPFFQTKGKNIFLKLDVPDGFTMERGLLYARAHQRVGREILVCRHQ